MSAILVSTHNLDEAERVANRVAVLQRRLVAIDTPASLRLRLTTGRVLVRVAGDPVTFLEIARRIDQSATVEGATLVVKLQHLDRETPQLVDALVAAGARVLEVQPEMPALEDVYLHLVGGHQ